MPKINMSTGEGVPVLPEAARQKSRAHDVFEEYTHTGCGGVTHLAPAVAETFAHDPGFYAGTWCAKCGGFVPLCEVVWPNGEPLGVDLYAQALAEQPTDDDEQADQG